jgi:hypothetical protein
MVEAIAIVAGAVFLVVALGLAGSVIDELDYWIYTVLWRGHRDRCDRKRRERNSREIRMLMDLLWGGRRR